LCSGTLEQIVNGGVYNDALTRAVNGETANLDTVLARNVFNKRRLADNLDELLTSVTVLVDVADVTRGWCC
jgi:hypothetical protein